jgi:hypothetical protein
LNGEGTGPACAGSSTAAGGSVWVGLAREALGLCAAGLAQGGQRWGERAAQRWDVERKRLGAQLLRGALALMLVWTALLLGLVGALLGVDRMWWPHVLIGSAALCGVVAAWLLARA